MARYKHIKPTFENQDVKEAQMHHRHRILLSLIWTVIELALCIVLYLFRDSRLLLGCGMILLGLISFGFTLLFDRLECRGPGPCMWYDQIDDIKEHIPRKKREQDREESDFLHDLICVLWLLFSIGAVLLGILRLCNVM